MRYHVFAFWNNDLMPLFMIRLSGHLGFRCGFWQCSVGHGLLGILDVGCRVWVSGIALPGLGAGIVTPTWSFGAMEFDSCAWDPKKTPVDLVGLGLI